jgi:hypothetical protein
MSVQVTSSRRLVAAQASDYIGVVSLLDAGALELKDLIVDPCCDAE